MGHEPRTGGMGSEYKIWNISVRKHRKHRHRLEDNIKVDLREMGYEKIDCV